MVRSTIGAHHFFVRHPKPEQLSAASPATAFLDLRWNEFFDKHTIDTFRPRFGNLPTLVAEIFDPIWFVPSSLGAKSRKFPATVRSTSITGDGCRVPNQ
jgi:hypothetical protein